jgi:hypothetical protein
LNDGTSNYFSIECLAIGRLGVFVWDFGVFDGNVGCLQIQFNQIMQRLNVRQAA